MATYSTFLGQPTFGSNYSPAANEYYTFGTEFYVTYDCNITGIWYHRFNTSSTATPTAAIYTVPSDGSSGSIVSGTSITFSTTTSTGWRYQAFGSPVAITANTRYTVVFYSSNTPYAFTSNYWTSGAGGSDRINGPLIAPRKSNATQTKQSRYKLSSTNTGIQFPNTDLSGIAIGVDVTVEDIITPKTSSDTSALTDLSSLIASNQPQLGMDSGVLNESTSLVVLVSASDTAAGAESRSGSLSAARSDTSALNEQLNSVASNISSDTAALSEMQFVFEGLLKVGVEIFALTEQVSIQAFLSKSDSASALDSQQEAASFYKADLYVTTDVVQSQNILTSEIYSLTEYIAPRLDYLTTQDTFTLLDIGASNRPLNDSDLFDFSEDAHVFEKELVTQDPFTYPFGYFGSDRIRVIAQDHFTREFIHWDLPVDNVQLTFTLSGPNLFSGKLSTEMPEIKNLDPPLTPDRTWLHIEQDNVIVASFIMTPFIDSPGDQTRQIEGEGFAGYPHWVYYEGEQFIGVQVDPADMIRKLWDHVQDFPDGNLGVKVWPTVTPVRTGFPAANVQFTTKDGNQVSFQAGPYNLNFWSVTNCGEEINRLCQETPIEYWEYSQWNENKTDVEHYIVLGYPRVGAKRNDLTFREGENLVQLIPSYQETQENYASDVFVIGAGTGPGAVRAKKSGRIGRIRKTNVIQDQTISNKDRAQKIADFEFNRISQSRYLIENITVDSTHTNARWGTFIAGDDIYVEGTVPYVGKVRSWNRITSYTYDVYSRVAQLTLQPSESFSYGATIVNPFQDLPIEGYAVLTNIDASADDGDPLPINILISQKQGVDAFNRNNIKNGLAYAYTISGSGTVMNVMNIGEVVEPSHIIIGRTEQGYLITGENVYLVAADGSLGQAPDTTAENPNSTNYQAIVPYEGPYPPDLRMAGREYSNAFRANIRIKPDLSFMGMSNNAVNWQNTIAHYFYVDLNGQYNYELKLPGFKFAEMVYGIAINSPFGIDVDQEEN